MAETALPAPPPQLSLARTHPEWSDLALFALACVAIWFVRRALRRRLPKD